MSDAPVWLLDVDGVINVAVGPSRPPTHAWPRGEWIETRAAGVQVWAARPVLALIREVHQSGRAEIRWHTTWQWSVRELETALDLPAFGIQEAPEYRRRNEEDLPRGWWWKLPPVWRLLTAGRRVLWTDDDAAIDLNPQQRTALAGAGCRIISPDPLAGLCQRHVRMINEYLPATVRAG